MFSSGSDPIVVCVCVSNENTFLSFPSVFINHLFYNTILTPMIVRLAIVATDFIVFRALKVKRKGTKKYKVMAATLTIF